MNGLGTKRLETERLILRRMEMSDASNALENWLSDEESTLFLTRGPLSTTEQACTYMEEAINLYSKPFYFNWLVQLKQDGTIIGHIEASRISLKHRLVELGYSYGSSFWNCGYATEALKAVLDFFFNQVGVEIAIACHAGRNAASGRVMQKAGMHKDAVLPSYFLDKSTSKRDDQIYYSLLKEEYLALQDL